MAKRKPVNLSPAPTQSNEPPDPTPTEDNLGAVAKAITPKIEEEKTPPPPTANPRNEALSRLARASLVDTGNDEAIGMNDDESGTDPESRPNREAAAAAAAAEANEAEAADEGDDVPVGADQAPPPPATTELPAKVHKVEVRGVVADVPEGEVIAAGLHALRHRGAAEMALREAHELLNRSRTVAQPASAPAQNDAPASPGEDERRLAEAIQLGSRDDAARAIAALMKKGGQTEEQIGGVVARLVETHVRDALDHDTASKALETEVPEMLKDPRVLAILGFEERAARAAGDHRPYSQLYPEIGKKVRTWIDGLKGPAPEGSSPPSTEVPARTIQQRTAAKAATPTAIPPKGGTTAATTQPPVKTGSQIVAEMRASRGNPNIRHQRRI